MCVEAPVGGGVGVLPGACATHREGRHGGGGAVIGQGRRDGETWSAIGAVDESVPVSPVGGIALFGDALIADRHVGGGQRAAPPSEWVVSAMVKPVPPRGGRSCVRTASITARGGGRSCNMVRKPATSVASPSISMIAPELSLRTDPARPSAAAVVYTNGRKPTPWTTPCTRILSRRRRSVAVMARVRRCRCPSASTRPVRCAHLRSRSSRPRSHVDDDPVAGVERLLGQHATFTLRGSPATSTSAS